jgi:hypothetical protein
MSQHRVTGPDLSAHLGGGRRYVRVASACGQRGVARPRRLQREAHVEERAPDSPPARHPAARATSPRSAPNRRSRDTRGTAAFNATRQSHDAFVGHRSAAWRFRPDAAHRVEPRWAFAVACALPATTRGRARRVRARFLRRPRDRRRHGPGAVQSVASALPLVLFGEARPFVLGVTHLSRAPGTRTTRARRGRATQ